MNFRDLSTKIFYQEINRSETQFHFKVRLKVVTCSKVEVVKFTIHTTLYSQAIQTMY